MKQEDFLKERSGNTCELSGSTNDLVVYEVPFSNKSNDINAILITKKCLDQIEKRGEPDSAFWEKILPMSMWSEIPAVQVVSWRMLNRFRNESWAAGALDMIYLEDDVLEWAKASGDHLNDGSIQLHKDSNGNILQNGDTVTLIKDLDVKGSSLNAKIGTAVRNIRLVHDNHEQIEGKVAGQMIVILTKFVKKQ
ncbi:PhnA domain-containing protein [Galbibacter pacificus]|uniref:PhnA domain-containing protein n=1 Tax=Galbibacter pacificus TaxID=2996052 RepID=A0ABT6FVG7_9FLAO|nr:alkylphosphonate utilization protein [Galbibacter pacificus]MDG3583814.1 PhnA domain-containing protein [Galbibacter pacificus]MDG3587268.1 PhnA domain-containing protein [Galbibacter pacificus]